MTWLPLLASVLIAADAPVPAEATAAAEIPEAEGSIKVSLSATDPNVAAGKHATTDVLEFYVFADGMANRGGEFGLVLEGGECLGFLTNEDTAWVVMPGVKPYPGTISQVCVGLDCPEPPVLYGKLLVKPTAAGKRIVVDVIPSERSLDVAILRCDNTPVNEIAAHPAVVNGGQETDPVPHLLARPPDTLPVTEESADTNEPPAEPPAEGTADK